MDGKGDNGAVGDANRDHYARRQMTTPPFPVPLKNAHELGPHGRRLWRIARLLLPQPYRALYEGHPRLPGQMWFEDRRVLYDTVRGLKPRRCFEVGTWLGGGSTLTIGRALRKNGVGRLHSVETDEWAHRRAREAYARHLPELGPFVDLHLGDYREVLAPVLDREGGVDFFVLDGAEDADETIEQFSFFNERSHPGTGLFAHDWRTEKCRLVRPALERSTTWTIERVVGPPKSIGLAVAHRFV
jgi:hypothetical protein